MRNETDKIFVNHYEMPDMLAPPPWSRSVGFWGSPVAKASGLGIIYIAVLQLHKHGDEETWFLSGWKENTPDGQGVSTNPHAYAPQTFGSRSVVGAGAEQIVTLPDTDCKIYSFSKVISL